MESRLFSTIKTNEGASSKRVEVFPVSSLPAAPHITHFDHGSEVISMKRLRSDLNLLFFGNRGYSKIINESRENISKNNLY